jgi:hypothetical protein
MLRDRESLLPSEGWEKVPDRVDEGWLNRHGATGEGIIMGIAIFYPYYLTFVPIVTM